MYSLIGYVGIIFMCSVVFLFIKYRKTAKVRTRKILFGFIVGIVSMFTSFTTLIVWKDITNISFITVLIGVFSLRWAMEESKISFNKEE